MGQILNAGFCFFALIIVASYTANLASFLITAQIKSTPVTSIDDANTRGLPVCVLAGTVAESILQSSYLKLQVVSIKSLSIADMVQAMNQGLCKASVMSQSDWDISQLDQNCNSDCNLAAAGSSFRYISG